VSQLPPAEQYFYQAADGQAAFLASLPARMLAAAAGGAPSDAAPRFSARVVEVERVTQTAATRRRYRTLSHVPLGGELTRSSWFWFEGTLGLEGHWVPCPQPLFSKPSVTSLHVRRCYRMLSHVPLGGAQADPLAVDVRVRDTTNGWLLNSGN